MSVCCRWPGASPLRAATVGLLVALAGIAAPVLASPAEARAQDGSGLCGMSVFPNGQGFDLGAHTVQVSMLCEELPANEDFSNVYSYERLRITSNDPLAEFASLEVGTCSTGASEVECPLLLGETDQGAELHGDLRFQFPVCDLAGFGTTVAAEYLLVGPDGGQQWHPISVRGPCAGPVLVTGGSGKRGACAKHDFRMKVNIASELRQLLLESVTFGGETSDEEPQFIAALRRKGNKASREPRLAKLKYQSSLSGFKIKVPAEDLPSGKYEVRVYLELNSQDDYPNDIERFKRC
jgi:hypothetical protein